MNLDALRACAAKGMTQADAARALNECRKRVSDWALRHNIPFASGKAARARAERVKHGTDQKETVIRCMVAEGATNMQIAAATGVSVHSIKRRIQFMRRRGEVFPKRDAIARATEARIAKDREKAGLAPKPVDAPKVPSEETVARAERAQRQERAEMAKRAEVILAAAPLPPSPAQEMPAEPVSSFKPIGGNLTRHDFFDWRHKRPVVPARTGIERLMDQHLSEIGAPDGWPASHDAMLVTATFGRGLKIDAAAAVLGVGRDAALARFKDLVLPLRGPTGALSTHAGQLVAEAIARRDAGAHGDEVAA